MSMKSTAAANICGAFAIFYVPFGLSLTAQQPTSSSTPNVACTKIVSDGTAQANQVTKFAGACKIEPSAIFESSGNVGINTPPMPIPLAIGGAQVLGINNVTNGGTLVDFDYNGLNTGSASNPGALYRMDLRPGQPTHQWWTRTAGTPFPSTLEDAKMVILQNGNVGIGTTNPGVPLDIGGAVRILSGNSLTFNNAANSGSGVLYFDGEELVASGRFWVNSGGLIVNAGNVGIGTANPQYPLSVNGTIQGKEVIVNTGWSDYVFAPEYRLEPLNEVAAYIHENHHLPDVPTEAEVQEKGIGLGETQAKLLAKIEELTLHMIAEHDRNDRVERENRDLKDDNHEIRTRLAQLEALQHSTGPEPVPPGSNRRR